MYIYRLGIAIMMAAVYALILGLLGGVGFLFWLSLIAVIVGLILAIGGASAAKYDENQWHRELLEALGNTETETKE